MQPTTELHDMVEYGSRVIRRGVMYIEPRQGLQVGRFAVRRAGDSEIYRDRFNRIGQHIGYVIDHVSSGIAVCAARDFASAMLVADDVSRFALHDPDGQSAEELIAQLGPRLLSWIDAAGAMQQLPPFRIVPYREWLTHHEAAA